MQRIQWLLAVVWLLAGGRVRGVEITSGPVVEPTSTNAVIRWTTDRTAGGRVQYGTSVAHLEQRAVTGAVGATHEVTLRNLKPGTTYWYTVGTAREPLSTNSFTTPGFSKLATDRILGATTAPRPTSGTGKGPSAPNAPSASGILATRPTATDTFDPSKYPVPPTRKIWGAPRTLQDHFDRHGRDFASKDPDDYAAKAWLFLRRARVEGLPAKLDEDGVLRVYEPKTRAFAAYNKDLTTKTYFKPSRPDYFDDQPGKPVDLSKVVK